MSKTGAKRSPITAAVPSRERFGRRRFLRRLAGLAGGSTVLYLFLKREPERLLSLREADYYRPHDLAG